MPRSYLNKSAQGTVPCALLRLSKKLGFTGLFRHAAGRNQNDSYPLCYHITLQSAFSFCRNSP